MAACSGLLEVAVVCAKVGDRVAASESLVAVLYGGVEERTRRAKRGSLTPVFNQSFKLSVLTGAPTVVRFELRSVGLLKGSLVGPTTVLQVGAADFSVERAMRSGLEEVCIALLGKDGSKSADLQLAIRFTAGSVTASLAALAAAPPPALPTAAAGAQQPLPLPPAAPRPPATPKGPLEAGVGAHGVALPLRPRSADAAACISGHDASPTCSGFRAQNGQGFGQGFGQGPLAQAGRTGAASGSLFEAAAAAAAAARAGEARPPPAPSGSAPGPAERVYGGAFSKAALGTWKAGQRLDWFPEDGVRPPAERSADLAPERSAASLGDARARSLPRNMPALPQFCLNPVQGTRDVRAMLEAEALPDAWAGGAGGGSGEMSRLWVLEAPSAPPAPAEVLAEYTAAAAAWHARAQPLAGAPDGLPSIRTGQLPDQDRAQPLDPPLHANGAFGGLQSGASACHGGQLARQQAGAYPPRLPHARGGAGGCQTMAYPRLPGTGAAVLGNQAMVGTYPRLPGASSAASSGHPGAYPQLYQPTPGPFDGALKAATGMVSLAAYPALR